LEHVRHLQKLQHDQLLFRALAAVAAATGAMAQATISGTVAFGFDDVNKEKNAGFQTTNVTIRATEDLGGGLRASGAVTLESGTNAQRGSSLNFADRSLSLAGGFGTVTFAQTRATNLAVGANVAAISLNQDQYATTHKIFAPAARRGLTAIAYTSPELTKGLRVNVQHLLDDGATLNATSATRATAQKNVANKVGVTYVDGPLSAAVAVTKLSNAAKAQAATDIGNNTTAAQVKGTVTEFNVTYDFGVARVGAGWSGKSTNTGKAATTFGISAPLASNISVGVNYGKRDKARYTDFGATYALSKRTSVSVAYGDYVAPTGGAALKQSRIRLAHTF
jgi:predicted porin